LVRQEHGGALLSGGVKGNRGGSGRPSKAIREENAAVREKCRELFSERLEILESIADNTETKDPDRIKALEVLARYGGVDKIALTVEEQPEEVLTPAQQQSRIETAWERLRRVRSIEEIEEMVTRFAQEQAEANV